MYGDVADAVHPMLDTIGTHLEFSAEAEDEAREQLELALEHVQALQAEILEGLGG